MKCFREAFCVLAAITTLAVSTPALAGVKGIPSQVEYLGVGQFNIPLLLVQVAGVNYIGQTTAPGCSGLQNQSVDTLKIWLSMAQAALLSGKNIVVYSTTCGSAEYITDIVLAR